MHYTTKRAYVNIPLPGFGRYELCILSLNPDRVEVYKIEDGGLPIFHGYLDEIPLWAGRHHFQLEAVKLQAQPYRHPGHPSLQTEMGL